MKTTSRILLALAALSTLVAPSARASITPDAKKVVDRYLEASGGRAAWEKTRSLEFHGSISVFGLKGTIAAWRQAPDQRATEIAIGPFQIKEWTDGGKSWRTDPSGKLLALDGKDLEQALAGCWFENERWLEADQAGGSVKLAGEAKDSLGTRDIVEVTPPQGGPRTFEFDRKTGLLVVSRSKNDQNEISVTSSDFRKVDGFLMAFHSTQEVKGASANNASIEVESVRTNVTQDPGRFTPTSGGSSNVTWLKTPGVAKIPFEYLSNHVWIRASVNGGEPADFIYDTGASVTVIDSAYAAKIGLATAGSMQATGAGAAGGASFANVDRVRVVTADGDGVEMKDVKAGVLNVNSVLAPYFWRTCAGILGFDAIVQFVNEIDFDGRTLTLRDPQTFEYSGKGAELPMTLAGHAPVVDITVDGMYSGGARVDIGSGSTVDLHTPFVKKYDLIAKHPDALTVSGGGFGGTFESKLARMKSLKIGPYTVDRPLVGLSTIDVGALASEDYAGNLGNRLFDRFKITLDYEHRKIWLEPGAKFSQPEPFSRLGAQFAQFGSQVRASQVLAKSPAAEAGLKEGDTVLSVDGTPIVEFTSEKLEQLFEQGAVGRKVAIEIERDGKKKKLTAKLRDLL